MPADPSHVLASAGPTIGVADAARVIGISRNQAYDLLRDGEFPAKTFRVGQQHRVVTASLRRLVSADETKE